MTSIRKITYLFILLNLLFLSNKLISQNKTYPNSFIINGNISAEQKNFYIKSIENADMETYRLKTEKVVLKFKNGFLLELLPAKELSIKNIVSTININNYSDHAPGSNYKYPIFQILDSGWITAEIQNNIKDK